MRKTRHLFRLWPVLAALALALAWRGPQADDDDPPAPQAPSVDISPKRQSQSGLKTQPLAAAAVGEEISAYGRIVDLSPLLDLRARYRAAQSELAVAEAALRLARQNHGRLRALHSESIIPTRELVLAESQLAADQARQEAAARRMREVREEAVQSFGGELFHQAVEAESKLFQGLLDHTQVLALVTLPAGQSLPATVRTVSLASGGGGGKTRPARLVAAAPQTDVSTQGETWFFAADAQGLRTGMRLEARIPLGGKAVHGVLLPQSAVVWRDGQPWVFVKTAAASFSRRLVAAHSEQGEAWFVAEGFAVGEEVVVVGAQMLLSEEQRRSGPHDGDDD